MVLRNNSFVYKKVLGVKLGWNGTKCAIGLIRCFDGGHFSVHFGASPGGHNVFEVKLWFDTLIHNIDV